MEMIFLLRKEIVKMKGFRNCFFLSFKNKGNKLSITLSLDLFNNKKQYLNFKKKKLFSKVQKIRLLPKEKRIKTVELSWNKQLISLLKESNTVININLQKVNQKIISNHQLYKEIKTNLKKHLLCRNHLLHI